jgi:hypothetical protein
VEVRIAPLSAFVLILGGIAAQVEASSHAPFDAPRSWAPPGTIPHLGWSTTAYDAVRAGGWAMIILGLIIVAVVWVRDRKRTTSNRSLN